MAFDGMEADEITLYRFLLESFENDLIVSEQPIFGDSVGECEESVDVAATQVEQEVHRVIGRDLETGKAAAVRRPVGRQRK